MAILEGKKKETSWNEIIKNWGSRYTFLDLTHWEINLKYSSSNGRWFLIRRKKNNRKKKYCTCKSKIRFFVFFFFFWIFVFVNRHKIWNPRVASVSNELIYFSKLNSSSFFSLSSDIPLMTHGLSAENISEERVTWRGISLRDGFNPLSACFDSLNSWNRNAKGRKPDLQRDCSNASTEIINTSAGSWRWMMRF